MSGKTLSLLDLIDSRFSGEISLTCTCSSADSVFESDFGVGRLLSTYFDSASPADTSAKGSKSCTESTISVTTWFDDGISGAAN